MDLAGADNVDDHWFEGRKNSIGEMLLEVIVAMNINWLKPR